MKKVLYTFILLSLCSASFAQSTNNKTKSAVPVGTNAGAGVNTEAAAPPKAKRIKTPPKDGFSARVDVDSNVVVPYADVREEDVYYSKRIWREVDLKDSVNAVLNNDKNKLIEIFLTAIKNEELTAYSPKDTVQGRILEDNDSFQIEMTPEEALQSARGYSEGVQDPITGKLSAPTLRRLRPDDFQKYRLKEDWILDVKRGVFEPRIIGIAPLKMVEGNWQPVFWIYFDEAREILARKRLMNPLNDASVMTYDDFFVRRLFSSMIVKQTNPGNRTIMEIMETTDPKDPRVIEEANRIQKSLEGFQNKMWNY
jgi:gliding motility associated protien GldN